MISSLFKIDGKIPVVQIILGVLIGIAGTFIYIRLYKPIFLNDAAEFMNTTKQIDEQQQQHVKLVNEEVEVTLVPPEELPKLQLQEIDENEGGDGEDDDEEEFENK